MVYQELMLAPDMRVWENIVLGAEPTHRGFLDKSRACEAIREMGRQHGLVVEPEALTGRLPLSQQQQVEILRVLYRGADVVILDEPTSVLTPQETEGLFAVLRSLVADGTTVIFVSHKLHEVLAIADDITVMRGGEVVVTMPAAEADRRTLARLIVGSEPPQVTRAQVPRGSRAMEVEALSAASADGSTPLHDVSLTLHRGRVLGVAGVSGNGQDELLEILTGSRAADRGRILLHDEGGSSVDVRELPGNRVRAMRDAGMAYVPVDRNRVGSAGAEPLWFSVLAGRYWRRSAGHHLLDILAARKAAEATVSRHKVKAASVDVRPGHLSGGNLQKFIVGRELDGHPAIIIAADPTRGVDIGSAIAIRQEIRDRVDAGSAALLVSTDLDELLELADDVVVMFAGRITASFERKDVTAELLGAAMTGRAGEDNS
jgi:simple sugar transport system ATP-binding protein